MRNYISEGLYTKKNIVGLVRELYNRRILRSGKNILEQLK